MHNGMCMDHSLAEATDGQPIARLSPGLDSLLIAFSHIPSEITNILAGEDPAPTDPKQMFGVRAAAISLLAPILANDLAAICPSRGSNHSCGGHTFGR